MQYVALTFIHPFIAASQDAQYWNTNFITLDTVKNTHKAKDVIKAY